MEHPNTTDDLQDLLGIELVGERFRDTYKLTGTQGRGSQAMAFRAIRRGPSGAEDVVLKIFRPSFIAQQPELAQIAYSKEWTALAQLNERVPPCPFVVRLLDGGAVAIRMGFESMRLPWLALELVEGGALGTTLRERVKVSIETTGSAFGPDRARRVLGCVFGGVSAIHEVGVVHRDLKPPNVLLCGAGPDELAKVSDFGVARQVGVSGTFGDFAVGTPGYASPEQMENRNVGPWSDVFSLAALTYFVITGEPMFSGSRVMQMASGFAGKFTPLEEQTKIDPALRSPEILAELTAVIADGTNPDFRQRIATADELWRRLEPIFKGVMSHVTTTMDAMTTLHMVARPQLEWQFEVASRPPAPLGLAAVSFDPDGHALAAGATGLHYWEGTRWLPVVAPPGLDPTAIRQLKRLGPRRWFACGEGGLVTVFSPERCEWRQIVGDGRVRLTALDLVSERTFALGGQPISGARGGVVLACLDGKWCAPVFVQGAAEITSIAPLGLAHWCVAGAGVDGRGILAGYRALSGQVDSFPVASARLCAVAADPEETVYAVGQGGHAFRMRRSQPPVLERVLTQRDLQALAVDPQGDVWAVGAGRVVRRPGRAPDETWTPVWIEADWRTDFVAIGAMLGVVIAVDRDGAVLCGRQRAL